MPNTAYRTDSIPFADLTLRSIGGTFTASEDIRALRSSHVTITLMIRSSFLFLFCTLVSSPAQDDEHIPIC